jgi:hypothetical protein
MVILGQAGPKLEDWDTAPGCAIDRIFLRAIKMPLVKSLYNFIRSRSADAGGLSRTSNSQGA